MMQFIHLVFHYLDVIICIPGKISKVMTCIKPQIWSCKYM